ncbi:MAG: dihydrodipicolinate reductase [Candidatus Riflebacteria bacterium]|nr:dihydrodipicolinate reductase [Candidatus Riflebacteria bacterium]
MKPIRVVQWGLGALGRSMVRLMLEKQGLQVVGAIESRKGFAGKDLGKVVEWSDALNIQVKDTHKGLLKKSDVDVVVHATTSFTREVIDEIETIVEAGIDCITLSEEMAFPEVNEPDLSKQIDALARRYGVTVLGAGFNPGFILDSQIIMLSACCHRVEKIEAERKINLAALGENYFRPIGIGLNPQGFQTGINQGTIMRHLGFKESAFMLSHAIGLEIDSVQENLEPIIASSDKVIGKTSLKSGTVTGCRHSASGMKGETEIIKLSHFYYLDPTDVKGEICDLLKIIGHPNITTKIEPEILSNSGAVAVAVNMIPILTKATPGLKRVFDLPIPSCLMGETAYIRRS